MYLFSFLKGVTIGASATYFFDPVAGARRRSRLRDRFTATIHDMERFIDRGSRDLANRCQGMLAEAKAMCSHAEASSRQIAERVRSTMGHYVSHPRAVQVAVEDGRIVLSGAILADEVGPFLAAVSRLPGVEEISNQLDVHEQPDVPGLQGDGRHRGQKTAQTHLCGTPGMQLLAAGLGTALAASFIVRQRPAAFLAGCAACGLFMRAVSNRQTSSHPFPDVDPAEQQAYSGM